MKKKLLSLMMAATLVATGSVSAFAKTIVGSEDVEHETEVEITGDVENQLGQVKPGTIQVTVPTVANFRVDSTGGFTGTSLTVKNDGIQKVDVYAVDFLDVDGANGIDVRIGTNLIQRNHVALNLQGNMGTAYFKSDRTGGNTTGVYSAPDLTGASSPDGVKVLSVNGGDSKDMTLGGTAGTTEIDNPNMPIQNKFTLTLKIKKANN